MWPTTRSPSCSSGWNASAPELSFTSPVIRGRQGGGKPHWRTVEGKDHDLELAESTTAALPPPASQYDGGGEREFRRRSVPAARARWGSCRRPHWRRPI